MNTSDPLYNAEASMRYRYYPPNGPFGIYTPPWLWCDGCRGGAVSAQWDSIITNRMNQPAYVTLSMWGTYSPARGSGTVYAKFRNDSSGVMKGRIRFVVVEDSVYYAAPNNDYWHNHTPRDYLPDTSGTPANLMPGDSMTASRNFTLQSGWNASRCQIITWFQNDSLRADSSKPVYQAGIKKIAELIGIEDTGRVSVSEPLVNAVPNPSAAGINFLLNLPRKAEYAIDIFDIKGCLVRKIQGAGSGREKESAVWDGRDRRGRRVKSGIYFYRIKSPGSTSSGKIVIL